jgi:hypothetical protein
MGMTVFVLEELKEGILGVHCLPLTCPGPEFVAKNHISLNKSLLFHLFALSKVWAPTL